MVKDEATLRIKELITYVTKRKKSWKVAVFDRKTKKRAVGNSLAEILEKLGEHSDELVVVDHSEWVNRQESDSEVL
jgi:hypothetical protein